MNTPDLALNNEMVQVEILDPMHYAGTPRARGSKINMPRADALDLKAMYKVRIMGPAPADAPAGTDDTPAGASAGGDASPATGPAARHKGYGRRDMRAAR